MEDPPCKIIALNSQLFVLGGKKTNKPYFSTNTKHDQLQIQKDFQMPQHSYLPANISFLCFVGHQGWIIHETPFQMLIVSGGKVSACSAPGKLWRLAAGTELPAIQGPAVCSRVTRAARALPVVSAVETAVCPPSVMAEMCGRLSPNSMPPHTPHTRTHTNNSHAMYHAHNHQRGAEKPQDLRTRGAKQHRLEWVSLLDAKWSALRLEPPNLNISCHLCIKRFVHAWNSKWFIV